MLLRFLLLLWCFVIGLLVESEHLNTYNWPSLTQERKFELRSQRDVSTNVSLDQVVMTGVKLSNVLFKEQGYTSSALSKLRFLLDFYVQTFLIDLFLDEITGKFQLCPMRFNSSVINGTTVTLKDDDNEYQCEFGLEFDNLLSVVNTFVDKTNTTLDANFLLLMFNLRLLPGADPTSILSNDPLSVLLINSLEDKLYTPTNLFSDRDRALTYNYNHTVDSKSGYPDLKGLLFTETKRVMVAVWDNFIPENTIYNSTGDSMVLFNKTTLESSMIHFTDITMDLTTKDQVITQAQNKWNFVYDDDSQNFNNETIRKMLKNGYIPIINHTVTDFNSMCELLNNSLWSWSLSEKINEETARDTYNTNGEHILQEAFKCATLTSHGEWQIANCYDEFYIVCRHSDDQFDWILVDEKLTYFDAPDSCPSDYYFTVPQSSLQQKALTIHLNNLEMNESVWIDMNSIAVNNCWVSGGPYSSCPYQDVLDNPNLISMLIPTAPVFLCLVISMLFLRLKSVPVQDNRKHWRKVITQYTKNEHEGVPS